MLTQDNAQSGGAERTRELEDILHYNQNILDRLARFEERLGMIKGRLSGPAPTEVSEGEVADIPGGFMGQLQSIHQATSTRCDAIAEWLDNIENVV